MGEGSVDWLMKDTPYFNRLCQTGGQIVANEPSISIENKMVAGVYK